MKDDKINVEVVYTINKSTDFHNNEYFSINRYSTVDDPNLDNQARAKLHWDYEKLHEVFDDTWRNQKFYSIWDALKVLKTIRNNFPWKSYPEIIKNYDDGEYEGKYGFKGVAEVVDLNKKDFSHNNKLKDMVVNDKLKDFRIDDGEYEGLSKKLKNIGDSLMQEIERDLRITAKTYDISTYELIQLLNEYDKLNPHEEFQGSILYNERLFNNFIKWAGLKKIKEEKDFMNLITDLKSINGSFEKNIKTIAKEFNLSELEVRNLLKQYEDLYPSFKNKVMIDNVLLEDFLNWIDHYN